MTQPVRVNGLLLFVVVAGMYALGSELAFSWFGAEGTNASFFPAAGVTLAALVLVPRRQWPIVLLAAGAAEIGVDLAHDLSLQASIGYAVANLTQPLVGALLLLALVPRVDLSRTRNLAAFVASCVVVAPAAGGAVGATTFVAIDGGSGWARFAGEWWVGDGLGVLVVGGAILALWSTVPRPLTSRRFAEGVLLATVGALSAVAVLRLDWFALVYLPIAFLVIMAFRVGTRGVAFMGAVVAFVVAEATAGGHTFWETLDVAPGTALLYLQVGVGVVIASSLALAAEIAQRERTATVLARMDEERRVASERAALFESERAARERAELLERHAAHVAAAASMREVAEATIQELERTGVTIAIVGVVQGEDVETVSSTGISAAAQARFASFPLTEPSAITQAIRTGEIVAIESAEEYERRYPGFADVRRETGMEAIIAVPLRGRQRDTVLGALAVSARHRGWLEERNKQLLAAIADQAALALERARSYDAEREARSEADRRAELLVSMNETVTRMAAAASAREISEILLASTSEAFGAPRGAVYLAEEDDSHLALASQEGHPGETVARWARIPVEFDSAVPQVFRTGAPIWIESSRDYEERFPCLAEDYRRMGQQAAAFVPLADGSGPVGVLAIHFEAPRHITPVEREMLLTLGRQGYLAMERGAVYARERDVRRRTELLERHAARLAAAVTVQDVAATTIADLESVGASAAWMQRVDESGLELIASSGVPNENAELYARYPRSATTPPAEAARTGALVAVATGSELDERYPHAAAGRPLLGYETFVSVPVRRAGGGVLAVLSCTADEARWLDESRRQLVLGLAEQCGVAFERAELYEREEAAAAHAAFLAELGYALEQELSVLGRAQVVVDALVADGAAAATIELEDGPTATADSPADEGRSPLRVLPLRSRGQRVGTLSVRPPERTGTVERLRDIAERAAIALDNVQQSERDREVSHSLQLSLLGGEPAWSPGMDVASAYLAGTAMLEVGGDWYDVFELPSGRRALVVGDVVGHGLEAAMAMGQLRGAVRALAPIGTPSELLSNLDVFVASVPGTVMSTLAYVELCPTSGRLLYACAGHPPPLVVSEKGAGRFLWEGRSAPLGASLDYSRDHAEDALEPSETIVLYTDGLIERRAVGLDEMLDALLDAAGRAAHLPSSLLIDGVLEALLPESLADDVCVLALRLVEAQRFTRSFRASPRGVTTMRRALQAWLEGFDVDGSPPGDLVLAVSEAAANAAEHAYGFDGRGVVHVDVAKTDGSFAVTVTDRGTWREPRTETDRGRGLTIMRAVMEDVSIESDEAGTRVSMRLPSDGVPASA